MELQGNPISGDAIHNKISQCRSDLSTQIIGQERLLERLLIALLSDGHLIVEGAPGLAKTTAIKALANSIDAEFQRIQFTPDLLPSDLTGTEIYRPQTSEFVFQNGPLFHNILLADEINRAPAKVQSALLEAMGERQITVGHTTYPLPELFMVMATQNPIEHEGTYPLPEAQLDRFLMHVTIDYPDVESEKRILELVRNQSLKVKPASTQSLSQADLLQARQQVLATHLAPQLEEYIVQFVAATRNPGRYSAELARFLSIGASPRATLALDRGVRAKAWLNGRDFVLPEDIQDLIPDVLRHRLILSFEAEAQGQTADSVVQHLLELVPVP